MGIILLISGLHTNMICEFNATGERQKRRGKAEEV